MRTDGSKDISGAPADRHGREDGKDGESGSSEGAPRFTDAPADKGILPVKTEHGILELIKQENSWEQILYDVVAIKNMDPWNLDIKMLSRGFAEYISGIRELDFRIPAKWVIIASILLRMKSDCIKILKMDEEAEEGFMDLDELEEMAELEEAAEERLEMEPLEAIPKRKPVRRVTITELVSSLKKVIKAEKRRELRLQKRKDKIKISSEDITRRIENLYMKIGDMLTTFRENEIKFSKLVGSWKRGKVVDTFIPLVQLDHEKRVACRQDKIFEEIFIKKKGGERPKAY
jgi:segregation and condensation protein A